MSAPKDGCYIRGLYMEGARWDHVKHRVGESRAKELFTEVPIIWLQPSVNRVQPTSGIYICPVYKTLTRAGKLQWKLQKYSFEKSSIVFKGTLSTTGHSTNFVFSVELPSNAKQTHWIKRGVAMLCALNY
jgi:dynein heavy chain